MDILTMNQSIFGNKFKEMCVPTNLVEMTYDEMEYVAGGALGFLTGNIKFGLDSALALFIGAAATSIKFKAV